MKRNRKVQPRRYSMLDEMMASPTEGLSPDKIAYQLGLMRAGIEELRTALAPSRDAWEAIADLVNLLETLVEMGELDDSGGWVQESAREMAQAAIRHQQGKALRLTGAGLKAVANAFEGYELAASSLSARTLIRAHRKTETRVREVRMGRGRSTDRFVVAL